MDCCESSNHLVAVRTDCPSCSEKGKSVQLITLKSLLKASALENIEPKNSFLFCSSSTCPTVYFSTNHSQTFVESDLKVPVYQKNPSMNVPVCYCFDWTRDRLLQAAGTDEQPTKQIKSHIQAGRCGCEVNNPQGSCCLGNVNIYIGSLSRK
ncbi:MULTISPECIES: putative iron-sulfur cluster-binding metallochaperone [Paenibacillus]|uniref:putative iron-sulfur cluster-binding metallochaperone n=1 Tax=Paenibacillus TaxID=44249 RepID=UPI000A0008B2|nr:copper chaperone Copz family protein [Paenibacillus sp. IHBB 10380]